VFRRKGKENFNSSDCDIGCASSEGIIMGAKKKNIAGRRKPVCRESEREMGRGFQACLRKPRTFIFGKERKSRDERIEPAFAGVEGWTEAKEGREETGRHTIARS